jgi:DNA modification methylase
LKQGAHKNWLWDQCPSDFPRRENKIFCPPVAYPLKSPEGSKNPYQKPLPLYWELLKRFTLSNDLVVELTGGSGTLVAACAISPNKEFVDRHGATSDPNLQPVV